MNDILPIADRIDARFTAEQTAKQDEVDALKSDNADLQARLDGKMVVNGDTSDGYHTFNELYDHRAKLFSVVVSDHKDMCWKSMHHHDGSMYDGMFIVGINTPDGQASYHYDVDPYWGMFDCKELDRAPEWDGHTPEQAIDRIAKLASSSSVMPLPVDADGVPCKPGDLVENDEYIPRKVVGYYLADESTPCVTLEFVSPSIEASRLHHVAPEPPEPPDSQERIDADAGAIEDGMLDGAFEYCMDHGIEVTTDSADSYIYAQAYGDLLRRQRELDGAGEQA